VKIICAEVPEAGANDLRRMIDLVRRKAAPVGKFDDEADALARRLTACLERAGGLGLAAPQIGCGLRVIAYDIGEGPQVVINPRIARSGGVESSIEGCLSLPGLYGDVPRAQSVVVKGRDARGRRLTLDATDLLARVLQHEIDHLDGVLFVDRVDPGTVHWLVGGSQQDGEPQRVYTSLEDALKVFEARLASRRASSG
jgi:peptide deformylase